MTLLGAAWLATETLKKQAYASKNYLLSWHRSSFRMAKFPKRCLISSKPAIKNLPAISKRS
ncbi:hypothetical protein AVDCRST_MAG94-3419 [uncultured Leptolyngbya sp.]|uniref:Uncharacterized protein n=1 Tax=uncultured Leptolyngbya sp. TaxID=332963 RepID=A0A6J4MMW1_9CYAN|nr:hypothetical protein AVDCRST_MAG94-3419 [uncultured Leptolyngbya sp.]